MRIYLPKLLALACSTAALLVSTSPATAQTAAQPKSRLLEQYAKSFNVSPEEAERRSALRKEIGELNAKLEQSEPDSFAGMHLEHTPTFRAIVRFKGDATATLARYTQNPLFVARAADVSVRDLVQTQSSVYGLLKALNIESTSRVMVSTGRVDFFVADPTAVKQLVATGALKVPSYVTFGQANRLDAARQADALGGRPLTGGVCTSGFVVKSSTTRYLMTAGHCGHTGTVMTYNGVALPVVGRNFQPNTSYDYQWHTTPGFTLTNLIDEGLPELRRINYVWPYANMIEDDFICKYGVITDFTCGRILTKYYNLVGHPGYVLVRSPGSNLSEKGDSGGPWFYDQYNEAWGIHSDDGREDSNDAVFMPVSYISVSNLSVLTTP